MDDDDIAAAAAATVIHTCMTQTDEPLLYDHCCTEYACVRVRSNAYIKYSIPLTTLSVHTTRLYSYVHTRARASTGQVRCPTCQTELLDGRLLAFKLLNYY
jgi:hypothetical protein